MTDLEATEPALTPQQAADILQISKARIYEFCRSGKMKHLRLNGENSSIRIMKSDLNSFLKDRMVKL